MGAGRILAVVTGTDEFEKIGWRTGLWLSELTHFSDVAEEAGFEVTIASPAGGKTPIDPESLIVSELATAFGLEGAVAKHYRDRAFMDRLHDTVPVDAVDVGRYDAIFLAGGHGALFDFPKSQALADLIVAFHSADKVVSAVCHGPAALLNVRLPDSTYLVAGRRATGFSWTEEIGVKRDLAVPFSLEDRLKAIGAEYSKGLLPFASHVVEDGRLITGQNPGSAKAVGQAVVKQLGAHGDREILPPIGAA